MTPQLIHGRSESSSRTTRLNACCASAINSFRVFMASSLALSCARSWRCTFAAFTALTLAPTISAHAGLQALCVMLRGSNSARHSVTAHFRIRFLPDTGAAARGIGSFRLKPLRFSSLRARVKTALQKTEAEASNVSA